MVINKYSRVNNTILVIRTLAQLMQFTSLTLF